MAFKKMRPRKKVCIFCKNKNQVIDYKDVETLKRKFLEIRELVDLTDEELDKVLCRLLERKILKEAPFIKSIKVKRELNGNQEYYEVIRINGKK